MSDEEDEEFIDETLTDNNFIKKNADIQDESLYTENNLHKIIKIVPDDKRIMSEIMSRAEYARVIAERAKQIENGAPIFINIDNEVNPIKIAEMEIRQKKSPMKIHRPINQQLMEIWRVNEMVTPFK